MATAKKLAIVYGFSEGWLTASLLRQALKKQGITTVRPARSKTVLAHSGGFLTLRQPEMISTLILVGPNTWHRSVASSLRDKLRFEYRQARAAHAMGRWLRHGLRNWFYVPTGHTLRLLLGLQRPSLPPFASRTIVIRNRYDPYCKAENVLNWPRHVVCLSLDGGHDDLWDNPEPYAEIVKVLA